MAASRKNIIVTLFALLLGSAVIQTCEGLGPIPHRKYYVRVENGLKGRPLHAHRKSRDDDLGERVLQPGDQFEWGFHINLIGTTLFFCNMWYDLGQKSFEVFNCLQDKFIYEFCGYKRCHWKPMDDGIYVFHAKTGGWDKKYSWDKK
ncbi:S-protein homolog 1-like [Punica granatum]|uniref:S-protein homolog n=1 Tax=Punica granatum TaxID=22663 RepID=A0A218XRA9_PUNGR|nr:S-protein homolog 1-like [Punica granatum]OWM87206.1 hypothetical protein CDL15_Pgr010238 [Punica granatum]